MPASTSPGVLIRKGFRNRGKGHPPLIWATDVIVRYIRYGGPVGSHGPLGPPWAPLGPLGLLGPLNPALAWLACLLCPALAWSGLGLSCLPCQQQQPAAFGGRRRLRRRCCCCWTRPRQGRQDRPRPDQGKARHNRQASQAKAGNR